MIEPKLFEFPIGWFIDCMLASGFSSQEIRRVSFIAPLEDRTCRMMRVGIRYRIDGAGQIYENSFLVGVEELVNSPVVNILALQYERLIDILGKELPKIRQIEKATKRLLGEPKLQSTTSYKNAADGGFVFYDYDIPIRRADLSYLITLA